MTADAAISIATDVTTWSALHVKRVATTPRHRHAYIARAIRSDALGSGRVLAIDDIGAHLPVEETDRPIQLFQNSETNSRAPQ